MRFLIAILGACLFGGAVESSGETTVELPPRESSPATRLDVPAHGGPRVTLFNGRLLPYEIVDGMAVHGGDMILGTAEEAASRSIGLKLANQSPTRDPLAPRHASAVGEYRLWPDRTIPYTIDANVPASVRQRIADSIAHWNDRTVLTLTPRNSEEDFVRFQMTDVGTCRATLGKQGGEQGVMLLVHCDLPAVIHEIGHAAGLLHEHQREDRDQHITYFPENLEMGSENAYSPTAPSIGPYNYASVMHYSEFQSSAVNTEPIFETIPPGMLIRQRELPEHQQGLSAGDIDAVARLYGVRPTGITLSTNPPGLDLVVDGIRVTSPRRYRWAQGSRHVIEAPLSQQTQTPGRRYLFGRWSDGGSRSHTITAGPETTWYEANFIVQQKVDPEVEVVGGGFAPESEIVGVRPPSADGYYTWRSPIELRADPTVGGRDPLGLRFSRWFTGWIFKNGGPSSNPIRFLVSPNVSFVKATFTRIPTLRLTTNVDLPVEASIDGSIRQLPMDVFICTEGWTGCPISAGGTIEVSAPELQADRYRSGVRYRFQRWSDGEARSHSYLVPVGVPASGVELKLHVGKEFELKTRTVGEGAIEITPASEDGYYADGARVNLQASPADGWKFVSWNRGLGGSYPNHAVPMDRFRQVEAVFTRARRLWPDSSLSFDLDATNYVYFPYLDEHAFYVNVPPGAMELAVSAEISTPAVDLDLYVRRGVEVERDFERSADYRDDGDGTGREVVVTRQSDPPLRPGPYFIALVSRTPFKSIRGRISARVEGSGLEPPDISANPRALTFVAPANAEPQPQRIELVNTGHDELRFTLGTNTTWLGAEPGLGTVRGGGSVAIEIAPRSAGLQSGHYTGELMVTAQSDPAEPASPDDAEGPADVLATVEVTFVKLPAD